MRRPRERNSLVAGGLVVLVAAMIGLSFAAIPLYRMFCAATGYGGTPQIGRAVSPGSTEASIVVRFNADTSPNLPWQFRAEQSAVRLKLGEEQVAFYSARNQAAAPVTGVATLTT